jgi:3-deoxy-D-manno-octulosonic-acid transferase
MLFLYNLMFPLAFIFFVPGMIIKYIRRGGEKGNYGERFAKFAKSKVRALSEYHGAVWVHSVSVGETAIALSMIRAWQKEDPTAKFVLSTTTTTGQGMAVSKAPEGVEVIFCPIDFIWFVRKTVNIVRPSLLVIFETEIWPNLIGEVRRFGAPVALVNARISDRSAKGYRRWSCFFAPVLNKLSLLSVQTEVDADRFLAVSDKLTPEVSGNLKFDQNVPAKFADVGIQRYFGDGDCKIILAASTHPGEERLLAETYSKLRDSQKNLKLIIVPRHAERGGEIVSILKNLNLNFIRRSEDAGKELEECDVLLADTTGEMLAFMNEADIVVMGKSMAGQNEGHNIIEPALLGKPIVTGSELRNFRFVLNVMRADDALITIDTDDDLLPVLKELLDSPEKCSQLGDRAAKSIEKHKGATERTIKLCRKLLK